MNKVFLYMIFIILAIYLFNRYYVSETKVVLKDHMEPTEEATPCDKPVNSDYEKAWTEENYQKIQNITQLILKMKNRYRWIFQ